MGKRYKLTENQKNIISKAINILFKKFDCSYSEYLHYFEQNDIELPEEYNVCNSNTCVKIMKKKLNSLKKNGELGKGVIKAISASNDLDHDRFEICAICGEHLNGYLTWIKPEFEYFQENKKTKEIVEYDYFQLFTIFKSTPSCDYQRNPDFKKEKKLFKEVVEWANYVVSIYSA